MDITTPPLATARLVMRAFGPADLEPYAAMCADAEVMRHIGKGGPVGREIAWGHGYAIEACRPALAHGRTQFGAAQVISMIRPTNLRSIAVASRLGATLAREIDFMGSPAQVYVHPAAR